MFNVVKIFLVILFVSTSQISNASNQKWEYLVKSINLLTDAVMTQQLSKLGEKNWELVNCSEAETQLICVFKRRA